MGSIRCSQSLGLASSMINNCMLLLFRKKKPTHFSVPLRVEEEVGRLLLSCTDIRRTKGVCISVLFLVLNPLKLLNFALVCGNRMLDVG